MPVSENRQLLFDWPKDGKLFVPQANKPVKVALLSAPDQSLPSSSNDKGLTITLPAVAPDKIDSVIVIDQGHKNARPGGDEPL